MSSLLLSQQSANSVVQQRHSAATRLQKLTAHALAPPVASVGQPLTTCRAFGTHPQQQQPSTLFSAASTTAATSNTMSAAASTSTAADNVPATWADANAVFLSHPSAAVPAVGIAMLVALRIQQQPLTLADAAVAASVVAFWLVQEWVVHRWLLHSSFEWHGRAIHKDHHQQPYHHVSLDPPALVIGVMLLASCVFAVLLGGPSSPLWATATAAYWSAGLMYEWLHYIVHTRWVPPAGWRGKWLREVRRHHMLHHMRNENFWLSFSAPQVDALFGTLPQRSTSVPLTQMARLAHGSAAAHKHAGDGSNGSSSSGSASVSALAASKHIPSPAAAAVAAGGAMEGQALVAAGLVGSGPGVEVPDAAAAAAAVVAPQRRR